MLTLRSATAWPIIAIAFFFAITLGCKKDLSVPAEVAESTDWRVSQEQFDNAKAGLKGEAATRFFDFNYAAQNNPNVVASADGRDENEDALRALCLELIAQNQQYNFAPGLISRVGYPMWSRSMFLPNQGYNNTPVVFLPFAPLNADSTEAYLMATPFPGFWHLQLTTRQTADSLIQSQEPVTGDFRFSLAVFYALDLSIFNKTNKTYFDLVKNGNLQGPPANDRDCNGYWQMVEVCIPCPIALTEGAEDRCSECVHILSCVSGHIDLLMTNHVYFAGNANANFPNIGTETWVNTLEEQGGYPLGSFFELKQAERVFCELHPLAALEIKENRTIAVQKQAAFWG